MTRGTRSLLNVLLRSAVLVGVIGVSPALAQTTNNAPAAAAAKTDAPVARPWMDASLDPSARADLILKEMTLDEKLQLTFGYFSTDAAWLKTPTKNWEFPKDGLPGSAGIVPGIARLGIPSQWQTDAGVGVASQRSATPRLRTSLPSGILTAATWNPALAEAGGAMIGNEAFLSGFNVQLAGGMNLLREPRNGRNFEYGGEDPLLAGVMTGHAIKGIQSEHVVSTMKHYAFNGQETNRFTIDHHVGEQAARQSDLLAFQIANEIGQPGSVMCSYNRVNGHYACENDWLLNTVLKKDWGFKGYVMSDWGLPIRRRKPPMPGSTSSRAGRSIGRPISPKRCARRSITAMSARRARTTWPGACCGGCSRWAHSTRRSAAIARRRSTMQRTRRSRAAMPRRASSC
ncbi:glycoside hydrolase family 3 N-terminal domain-containing protein [Sphingomonas aerolata]|uniref:glycoside hydrolase family 3 protein n=1 Tax=Sphingomonas aerolata TaxID=185951 RepID=UPI002FDF466A